jgi:hypothetical protein
MWAFRVLENAISIILSDRVTHIFSLVKPVPTLLDNINTFIQQALNICFAKSLMMLVGNAHRTRYYYFLVNITCPTYRKSRACNYFDSVVDSLLFASRFSSRLFSS